jgi:hypothetical protein
VREQARTSTADRFARLVEHISDDEFEHVLAVARNALRALDPVDTQPGNEESP